MKTVECSFFSSIVIEVIETVLFLKKKKIFTQK